MLATIVQNQVSLLSMNVSRNSSLLHVSVAFKVNLKHYHIHTQHSLIPRIELTEALLIKRPNVSENKPPIKLAY